MFDKENYLKGLSSGDVTIIKKIYNDNYTKVKAFVLQNKGQAQDAEDVFQKALLQLTVRYKKEPFEIHSSFEAYLFTVCKNLWRRELNKSKNRVTIHDSIELKDEKLPEEFKDHMENWMFGCDICQDVCPWNRFAQQNNEARFQPNLNLLEMTKENWMDLNQDKFSEIFRRSAVKRTKYSGLKRNIDFLKK